MNPMVLQVLFINKNGGSYFYMGLNFNMWYNNFSESIKGCGGTITLIFLTFAK